MAHLTSFWIILSEVGLRYNRVFRTLSGRLHGSPLLQTPWSQKVLGPMSICGEGPCSLKNFFHNGD